MPLPPYSPELNPIEQTWAVLKYHITELLRKLSSISECFEYYFKT
ncbi:transposase [Streptococcus merionis]